MSCLPLSLAEAAQALARREVSSVDLVQAALNQAAGVNPDLQAFLRIDDELALAHARVADLELARGHRRGLLHGIPLAHKDMFYRSGVPSSCGAKLDLPIPTRTSTALSRLDAAGAIQIGVLNMSAFAVGPTGHNVLVGDCRNPWDTQRITGGSSSGSAAAVAARACWGALGSDTAGSIRLPAAMCGVTGLKPTYGRVSRAGVMGLSGSLDVVGPLARTAQDCAWMMQVMAGPDEHDPTTLGLKAADFLDQLAQPVRGWRIGVALEPFQHEMTPETGQRLHDSAEVLRSLGCELVPVTLPDWQAYDAAAGLIMASEGAALHLAHLREKGDALTPQMRIRLERGLLVPAPSYINALRLREAALGEFMRKVFDHVDVLLAPVMPIGTPTLTETATGDAYAVERVIGLLTRYTRPISYLGLPSLVLPMGPDAHGMPLGQQFIGPPLSEPELLRLGHAFQQVTSWHNQVPSIGATQA